MPTLRALVGRWALQGLLITSCPWLCRWLGGGDRVSQGLLTLQGPAGVPALASSLTRPVCDPPAAVCQSCRPGLGQDTLSCLRWTPHGVVPLCPTALPGLQPWLFPEASLPPLCPRNSRSEQDNSPQPSRFPPTLSLEPPAAGFTGWEDSCAAAGEGDAGEGSSRDPGSAPPLLPGAQPSPKPTSPPWERDLSRRESSQQLLHRASC